MNDRKPEDQQDHADYDGIIEQDNPLPRWWVTTFYLCVIFAAGYYAHYQLGPGKSLAETYEVEAKAARYAAALHAKDYQPPTDTELTEILKDSEALKLGQNSFTSKCASCHGNAGQGGIGPNLTDEYWLHGSKPSEIFIVIREGVLDKGMPAWKSLVRDPEAKAITAFLLSLKGTHPPGAKAPQGVKAD